MKETSIMVFGDSITYGEVDTEYGGWVNRLRLYLDNEEKNDFNTFNLGISGEISEETLIRFESECSVRYDKEENTIIIFAIGINDAQDVNGKYRVSIDDFENNIKKLVSKAKKFTDNILFIGLTKVDESKVVPWPGNTSKSFFNEKIIKFDNLLEKTCDDENVLYLKIYNLLSLEELGDGLHPNNDGHQKICDVVLNKIKDLIK